MQEEFNVLKNLMCSV